MIKQLLIECLVFARNCANLLIYYHISSPQQSQGINITNPCLQIQKLKSKEVLSNLFKSHNLKILKVGLEPISLWCQSNFYSLVCSLSLGFG